MYRRRRPPATACKRSHFLAALALASGSVGSLLVSPSAAWATNHGLFNRGHQAQPAMVITPTAFPVLATSSYTVLVPTVATSYVIAPTVQVVPTAWYTTTSLLLPMETACAEGVQLQPAVPEAGKVPELQEIPHESKPAVSPQEKPPATEPPFNPGAASPPIAPLAKPATKTPPAAKPADAPPANKEVESKPLQKKEEPKTDLPADLPENVNPLPPAKPKVTAPADLPPANPPAAKPADVKAPAPIDLPPNDLPAAKPPEKPAVPAAKPAEKAPEKPKDALIPPPAAEIPLPEVEVPKLESAVPPPAAVKPTTASAPSAGGPKDKPPVVDEPATKIDLPPPAAATRPAEVPKPADLPKSIDLPKPADEKPAPVIPLPDIPPPASGELPALPPAEASITLPELKDETGKKVADPGAIKTGSEKGESEVRKRESLRPVLSNSLTKPELAISVKNKATGLAEKDVRVLFRQPQAGTIKFQANTGATGQSSLDVPEGRWEVLVETPGGTLYVLGELISAKGKVTTVSGRALPVLEINR